MDKINHKKTREFGSLELLAKQVVEGFITGLHKSPFHGFSVEFAEHRQYNKGESTKHIDWKLYARTDKLFNKIYEEETNLRCQVVLDTSPSMYFPVDRELNKISFSVDAAAALIYIMRKQRDAVGLSIFSDQVRLHTKAKTSISNQRYLFTELEKHLFNYKPSDSVSTLLVDSLHHVAEMTHKRSLIMIFSDLMGIKDRDMFYSSLQHLRHNKHEVVLFHVLHSEFEQLLDYENRPYTFIDMESNKKIKLNPSQIKESYKKIREQNNLMIKNICGQYRIDYVYADITKGFHQVLLQYLIKRQKMI